MGNGCNQRLKKEELYSAHLLFFQKWNWGTQKLLGTFYCKDLSWLIPEQLWKPGMLTALPTVVPNETAFFLLKLKQQVMQSTF
jgi:hypothetical protein